MDIYLHTLLNHLEENWVISLNLCFFPETFNLHIRFLPSLCLSVVPILKYNLSTLTLTSLLPSKIYSLLFWNSSGIRYVPKYILGKQCLSDGCSKSKDTNYILWKNNLLFPPSQEWCIQKGFPFNNPVALLGPWAVPIQCVCNNCVSLGVTGRVFLKYFSGEPFPSPSAFLLAETFCNMVQGKENKIQTH